MRSCQDLFASADYRVPASDRRRRRTMILSSRRSACSCAPQARAGYACARSAKSPSRRNADLRRRLECLCEILERIRRIPLKHERRLFRRLGPVIIAITPPPPVPPPWSVRLHGVCTKRPAGRSASGAPAGTASSTCLESSDDAVAQRLEPFPRLFFALLDLGITHRFCDGAGRTKNVMINLCVFSRSYCLRARSGVAEALNYASQKCARCRAFPSFALCRRRR